MPRKKNSLKFELFLLSTKDVKNNRTRTTYKRAINRFVTWAKNNNIKRPKDITEEVLQLYHDNLKNDSKQYTAATIHTYLASICKATDINMNRIRKDKRTSDKIIRGRKKNPTIKESGRKLTLASLALSIFRELSGFVEVNCVS